MIAPRDLTKLGLLYLHKGVYNGIRILTEEWVTEASYPHISTNVQGCAGWGRHYGYQIWENSPGSYRADGAFGQYCMVFPKMDMVITTTAEETDGSRIFPLIEKYILNNITEQPKPRDAWCYQYMKNVMNQWETPIVYSPSASYLMHMLQGKEFDLRSRTSDEKHTLRFEIGNSRMEFVIDEIQTKLATTSSTGGLLLALQRAIVTIRPKGRYRKHFCWPAIKRYYSNLLVSILLLALLYTFELLHLLYCQSFQHNIL